VRTGRGHGVKAARVASDEGRRSRNLLQRVQLQIRELAGRYIAEWLRIATGPRARAQAPSRADGEDVEQMAARQI
jgi:hypothetical protein